MQVQTDEEVYVGGKPRTSEYVNRIISPDNANLYSKILRTSLESSKLGF